MGRGRLEVPNTCCSQAGNNKKVRNGLKGLTSDFYLLISRELRERERGFIPQSYSNTMINQGTAKIDWYRQTNKQLSMAGTYLISSAFNIICMAGTAASSAGFINLLVCAFRTVYFSEFLVSIS